MRNSFLVCMLMCVMSHLARPPVVSRLRMPSKPYISGDGFRAMADHVFDETDRLLEPLSIRYADIVFVKSDLLDVFFLEMHPKIKQPYILISHNSDAAAPGAFSGYLKDKKMIHWFGQNPTIKRHPKFTAIPIGLANRYVHNTGNVNNFFTLFKTQSKPESKKHLLGINFNPQTNLRLRKELFDYFDSQPFSSRIFASQHLEYLKKMFQAKFILSPPGNGLDCHRTWEAIIVGAVPVVLSSPLDELFNNMPVLIVDNWQQTINEYFLEAAYQEVKINKSVEKTRFNYWQKRLLEMQKKLRNQIY